MREPSSGKRDLLIRLQRSNPRNAPRAVKARYQPVAVRAARHDDGIGVPLGEGLQKAERRICGGFVLPFVDAIDKEKQALIVIRFSYKGDQVRLVLPAKPSLAGKLQKMAVRKRGEARLAKIVPYNFDSAEKLDPMALLEEVMQHFYRRAKIEESLGRFCDFRIVDNALQNAARIAREIVSFRRPRISAIKLAVADPNADLLRGDMTADEMREIIRGKLQEDGLLPAPLSTMGL